VTPSASSSKPGFELLISIMQSTHHSINNTGPCGARPLRPPACVARWCPQLLLRGQSTRCTEDVDMAGVWRSAWYGCMVRRKTLRKSEGQITELDPPVTTGTSPAAERRGYARG
jgi:hypothetical protein